LNQLFKVLDEEPQPVEDLRPKVKLAEEEFDKALEKLEIHGGALVDFGGSVTRGGLGWRKTYTVQAQHRTEQFERVLRFTASNGCRMAALVRHFGDVSDAGRPCGQCDVCDPAGAVLRQFRRASAEERELVQEIIEELRPVEYKATGTLQRNNPALGRLSRESFDGLLNAMLRQNLIVIEEAEYEKDGETRRFRKVSLTEDGLEVRSSTALPLLLADGIVDEFGGGRTTSRARKAVSATRSSKKSEAADEPIELSAEGEALATRLKEWRVAEAKKIGLPAYMVLNDRTLRGIAAMRPKNPRELLEVNGMGPAKAERFGEALLALCLAC
jgi:superfamily II DNA helicase RecQ